MSKRKVKQVINSFFTSCTYAVENEVCICVLVDSGDVNPLLPLIKGSILKGVLLTHAHFDHIYGLNDLLKHFPNTLVYTNMEIHLV